LAKSFPIDYDNYTQGTNTEVSRIAGSGEMKIMIYKISLWLILTSFVGFLVACDSAAIDGKEPNGKSQFISKKSAVTGAINESTKAARLRHATISIQPSQYYLNGDRLFLKLTRL